MAPLVVTPRRVAPGPARRASIRSARAVIDLSWEEEVSRLHGVLEPIAGKWVLSDYGLSRNGSFVKPSNQQIADELVLSVNTVKTHMRRLAAAFGVSELPKNQQRARIVELALEAGLAHPRDPAQQP